MAMPLTTEKVKTEVKSLIGDMLSLRQASKCSRCEDGYTPETVHPLSEEI